ncbi:MAG: bifunctional 2-polyprenyl-6-hydroxyphenol methylase/3-demethylubiquinol 3-O-methyltransferase UbiG [Sphingomonadales bacterium]|nr:bifunctional 2-polyprenyl-6-hydroxyphenol methylase/3-demethylubiquinol 3-O-methyltransferase UbiG [Sphingomonadales bacterium]
MTRDTSKTSTIDPGEVERFGAIAESWWDPNGPFRPLHVLNPTRLTYIRDTLLNHFGRDATQKRPFEGLRILDIGCGGGLLSEPLARLGAEVIGADATERNIHVARHHAEKSGLDIDYRHTSAEALADDSEKFDAVINMEVIEHVADVSAYLTSCHALLKSDGVMLISTINRTTKAYMVAILGAEYVLGWLPKGTHTYEKFLKPSELNAALENANFKLIELKGLTYKPFRGAWYITDDLTINYMGTALPL